MPDSKISALPAATALGGAEMLAGVQAGATVRVSPAQLQSFVLGQAAGVEMVQDIVGALIGAGGGVTVTYDDAGNALTIAATHPKANVASTDPGAAADTTAGYAAGSSWLNTATATRWACLDASAGAAIWYPTGALTHPGYVSGRTYRPAAGALVTGAVAADTLYAIPTPVGQRVTVSALAIRVTTAVTGNVRLGLYGNANGGPGAKLAEVASPPSTGAAAMVTSALAANVTLAPGIYWLAAIFSAAPSCTLVNVTDEGVVALTGAATALDAFSTNAAITGVTGSGTYAGGLPASFGTATPRQATSPLLGFVAA